MQNIFTKSRVCELGVTFLSDGRKFSYDFKYDAQKEEFFKKKFVELLKDQYGNEKECLWLLKDSVGEEYFCVDEDVIPMISMVAKTNLLCYLIDTSKFEHLKEMKQIIIQFAEKIDIINMNNIPMKHTIELMKNRNQLQQKVVAFIKNADLYMDNFEYVDMDKIQFKSDEEHEKPEEKVLDQMIFTVHDINLMDCKRMFRKEQIWFVHKDNDGIYVYSLADLQQREGSAILQI